MKKMIVSLFVVSLMSGAAYAQTSEPTLGNRVDNTVDKLGHDADKVGDRVKEGYDKTKDAVKEGYDKTKDSVKDGAEKLGDAADKTGDKIKQTYDDAKEKLLSHKGEKETFVVPGDGTYVTTSFIDTDVFNDQGEEIGTIKDVVIDDNEVSAVILSVGGFLGMGEHYVAVNPKALKITQDNDKWKVSSNLSKDEISAAPEYKFK